METHHFHCTTGDFFLLQDHQKTRRKFVLSFFDDGLTLWDSLFFNLVLLRRFFLDEERQDNQESDDYKACHCPDPIGFIKNK